MDWREARQRTIAKWEKIRRGIGTEDPVDLVAELNAICELCEKAQETGGDSRERCNYCIVFEGKESCRELNFKLSQALLDEEWDSAREQIDEMLRLLYDAQLPPEQTVWSASQ